jgi:threonine dehydrogenase-like Zn-dependent dehydrogenase
MRAVRYYDVGDVRYVEDVPEPSCGDDQIKIAPAYVGICGTDLHEYLGGPVFCPKTPHPVTGDVNPVTLGHEFSGTVAEVGKNAEAKGGPQGLKPGDKVVVQPTISCGRCGACKEDAENCCYKGGFVGLSGGGGGLSDFVSVPARRVLRLPENVPLTVGALVEPLAVAWHAISASPLKEGDTVVVLGGGPIGLAVLQGLKAWKAGTIIVAEVSRERQRFSTQFGADHVFDPANEDVVAKVRDICKEKGGADVVFDCAGVPASINTACKSVRSLGTVVNVAIWEKEIPFNPNMLVFREAKYVAVLGYLKRDFEYVLKALGEEGMQPSEMITKIIPMKDVVEGGFRELINNKESHVKILLEVAGG